MEVLKELPPGARELCLSREIPPREAYRERHERWHWCPHCAAWVEGHAISQRLYEYDRGSKCMAYYCRNCGKNVTTDPNEPQW